MPVVAAIREHIAGSVAPRGRSLPGRPWRVRLWISGASWSRIDELDPSTGRRRKFALGHAPLLVRAWADGYGALWWSSDESTRLTRLTPATGAVDYSNTPPYSVPFAVAVAGDSIFSRNRSNPEGVWMNAVGREQLPPAELSGVSPAEGGVIGVAAASGHVWAATNLGHGRSGK